MLFAPTATGLRHLLFDAAILQEFLLILLKQTPEQKISLVDKNIRAILDYTCHIFLKNKDLSKNSLSPFLPFKDLGERGIV